MGEDGAGMDFGDVEDGVVIAMVGVEREMGMGVDGSDCCCCCCWSHCCMVRQPKSDLPVPAVPWINNTRAGRDGSGKEGGC